MSSIQPTPDEPTTDAVVADETAVVTDDATTDAASPEVTESPEVDETAETAASDESATAPVAEAAVPADEPVSADVDDAPASSDEPVAAEPAVGDDVPAADVADDAPAAAAPADDTEPALAAVPVPGPRPTPASVRTTGRPAAPASTWGRVDDDGTVSVREGDQWRVVGQYPDGTPAEALAYFERKFADIAFKVQNLEQRVAGGGASASELNETASNLIGEIEGAQAVGDLADLAARVNALTSTLAEATAEEAQAAKAAVDEAIAHREQIVVRAEAIAARDPKSIQWKQVSVEVSELFDAWQSHQQTGPRLPKSTAQALWKRFRAARSTVERHRREFFAQLDETHKSARNDKTKLVERAEALAPKGEQGIPAYRALLDEWKSAGRAGRKVDDALWARFKAAGDLLYQARSERDVAEQEESAPRIEARQALIAEAAAVADEADLRKARQLLTSIQRRWDEVGRIFPRDRERQLDDEMRKVEQALRAREDVDWKRNNPETQARADGMTAQLLDAIAKLEAELAAAEAAGDRKAAAAAKDALDARRTWLQALGG